MYDCKQALALYLVTDKGRLEGRDFYTVVEEALAGGITMLQLREKKETGRQFYETAVRLKAMAQKYQVPFLINDRIDIALAVDADGVHVGQKDIPVAVVRELVGKHKIVGATANTALLAQKAQKEGADYVGAGAVFATGTKEDAKPLTKEELTHIAESITIPVVAIGGITVENAPKLVGTQIAGLAVSSGILASHRIKETIEAFHKIKL